MRRARRYFFFETNTPIYSWWLVCARRESGGLHQRAEREEINHHLWVASFDVWRCRRPKTQEDKRGARKGDLCFETHLLIDAISPRFDDVKDDDDDDGEFCFGRERGFKTTLEREV